MKTYRDEAIVLRTHKLGEADRILTLLTRANGQVRAVAKGVRRTQSKFGGRLEPFNRVDLQLYRGHNLDTVTQAESIHPYSDALARDYDKYTRAAVMAEAAMKLTDDDVEAGPQQYLLLLGALHALATGRINSQLVLDSYLLRALAIAGWAPSFHDCAVCGAVGPHRSFNVSAGGAVCENCRPPGSATPTPQAMALLGSLLSGDWAEAGASAPKVRGEASGLVAAFVQWNMERRLRSLILIPHPSEG
ncbi:DNA repair protein RecO [Bowdeniella nasicola]|uniref:DNA repair protein RecO n=1 Tax=Bowdeniella nasicola TaxID=208480 RepID=A0A1Q5Q2J0_9ACTO|nr:DNA repair protein RecO [Bowdeniella nasicola]OKL54064.1 DNA repair protein RecO [Bowdeniella nasicola]